MDDCDSFFCGWRRRKKRYFAGCSVDHERLSRQAVVKHLSALADAGLLDRAREGREVRYSMTPAPLSEAVSWMADVGGQWDDRLASLRSKFNPS